MRIEWFPVDSTPGDACVGLDLSLIAATNVMSIRDRIKDYAVLQATGVQASGVQATGVRLMSGEAVTVLFLRRVILIPTSLHKKTAFATGYVDSVFDQSLA